MIIVSQNKKNLYNFDNVKSIDIVGNEIYISDDILSNMGTCIANYETEKRAKEVLQEITKTYFGENCEFENGMYHLQKIYEMPKE